MHIRNSCFLPILCLLLTLLITLPGCFDARDIEHRALVLAVAIDRSETGSGYSVTVQIAVPGEIGGGEGGGDGEPSFNVSAESQNIAGALAAIQAKVALPLFFGHTRLIAVSDGIAETGLADTLDFFRRSAEVRRTAWLIIGQPTAAVILETKLKLEQLPVLGVIDVLETQAYLQHLAGIQISSFWSRLDCPAEEPIIPILIRTEDRVDFGGTAVFRDDRMIGTFSRDETAYLQMLHGRPVRSDVTVELPDTGAQVTVNLTNVRTRVVPRVAGDSIAFTVKVRAEGRVTEETGPGQTDTPAGIAALETVLSQAIAANLRAVINKEQREFRVDPYPFGEIIRARHPSLWRRIDWRETFPTIPVDIQVTSFIRHIGETRR
ncbi:MAG: Ger(x)C family spore germination protein [bacterium]|jgi:spore germination protein KC